MDITIGIILYKNAEQFNKLWQTVIKPTISYCCEITYELIVVDNSPKMTDVGYLGKNVIYVWNGGRNEFYAGGMNKIVKLTSKPYIVYLCSNHGRMTDPTWIEDLVEPLENAVMAGDLQDGIWGKFIQGGVFAARTDIMRENPYGDYYRQDYTDCWLSNELTKKGHVLANVPTIKSVWRSVIEGDYKYIHDEY